MRPVEPLGVGHRPARMIAILVRLALDMPAVRARLGIADPRP